MKSSTIFISLFHPIGSLAAISAIFFLSSCSLLGFEDSDNPMQIENIPTTSLSPSLKKKVPQGEQYLCFNRLNGSFTQTWIYDREGMSSDQYARNLLLESVQASCLYMENMDKNSISLHECSLTALALDDKKQFYTAQKPANNAKQQELIGEGSARVLYPNTKDVLYLTELHTPKLSLTELEYCLSSIIDEYKNR